MNRPLSPHLQIYHPAMTMIMSIAHRLSGLLLYGLILCLIAWLSLLAFAPTYFDLAQSLLARPAGEILLFLALWVFCHHLFGGVRYFLWDLGFGLGVYGREWLVWGGFIFGVLSALGFFFAPEYEFILREFI